MSATNIRLNDKHRVAIAGAVLGGDRELRMADRLVFISTAFEATPKQDSLWGPLHLPFAISARLWMACRSGVKVMLDCESGASGNRKPFGVPEQIQRLYLQWFIQIRTQRHLISCSHRCACLPRLQFPSRALENGSFFLYRGLTSNPTVSTTSKIQYRGGVGDFRLHLPLSRDGGVKSVGDGNHWHFRHVHNYVYVLDSTVFHGVREDRMTTAR